MILWENWSISIATLKVVNLLLLNVTNTQCDLVKKNGLCPHLLFSHVCSTKNIWVQGKQDWYLTKICWKYYSGCMKSIISFYSLVCIIHIFWYFLQSFHQNQLGSIEGKSSQVNCKAQFSNIKAFLSWKWIGDLQLGQGNFNNIFLI